MPRVHMDEYSQQHVSQRIRERIRNADAQQAVVALIKKLVTLDAPSEAVGQYQWHINLAGAARVVLRGHSVRTVLSMEENFPGGTEYRIVGRALVRV